MLLNRLIKQQMKANSDNMEDRILQHAERLFIRKGYALTSMTEIAKEAGCNQALVHYYFRTKEKLFQKIFEEKIIIFFNAFNDIESVEGDFLTKFQRRVERYLDLLSENSQLPFMLLNEITTNPSQLEAVKEQIIASRNNIFNKFEKELNEAVKNGEVRAVDAVSLTLDVFSLSVSIFLFLPVLSGLDIIDNGVSEVFVEERKKAIVQTIINSLRV